MHVSSPWNKHTRVEMKTIVSHYTENIWKVKRGSGCASPPPPPPPEASRMKRSQIKWKLLLFDESDFFSFEASLFFILFKQSHVIYYIANQGKCIFKKKPNQIIKWSGLKRMYNICIVKKAKLEISGNNR